MAASGTPLFGLVWFLPSRTMIAKDLRMAFQAGTRRDGEERTERRAGPRTR